MSESQTVTDPESSVQTQGVSANSEVAESAAPEAAPAASEPRPQKTYFWGTGRRKRSVARVRIRDGTGQFEINGRQVRDYFKVDKDRAVLDQPLRATGAAGRVDVFVNVYGGGTTGQADAIVMGLARALKQLDTSYEKPLRDGNYLTRDARKVERKKYGQRGARRRFQFSKR